MKLTPLIFLLLLFTGCATLDKAIIPVDETINKLEAAHQKSGHSREENFDALGDATDKIKSAFHESAFAKFFSSDETIAQNRKQYFVVWNSASEYDTNKILIEKLKGSGISDPETLKTSDKMKILKEYFFQVLKEQHAMEFASRHKKPEFNEFLTDRENINLIHEYKIALAEAEHQWRINLSDTQKKVAQLMLSTLYSEPILKYISYNPYDEAMFLSIESKKQGFMEKIKVDIDKNIAPIIKTNISNVAPDIFFKFNDDVLEFVGINITFDKKTYVCDVVDSTYARQSDVVFTSDDISLESLDVQYYNVVKMIKPPQWFNNIKADSHQIIGFGEGIKKADAKKEAYKDIAMSIKTTVSASFESEKTVSGSTSTSKYKSSSKQKVEDISIKGSKVLKIEKKDGLWFVAIAYTNQQAMDDKDFEPL